MSVFAIFQCKQHVTKKKVDSNRLQNKQKKVQCNKNISIYFQSVLKFIVANN